MKPAQRCLNDLHTFGSQLKKAGYWQSGGRTRDGFIRSS